jgi:hypothetical protein
MIFEDIEYSLSHEFYYFIPEAFIILNLYIHLNLINKKHPENFYGITI